MAVHTEPRLKLKSMIPVFQLMTAEGNTVNPWDYKGKKNLVLAFLPAEGCATCEDFLRSVSVSYHRYHEENTVFLAVVRGTLRDATELRDRLHPPFQVLYEETGAVTHRYTDSIPAVFVADKFGQLYAEWLPETHRFPAQKEILDVVELINLECPE